MCRMLMSLGIATSMLGMTGCVSTGAKNPFSPTSTRPSGAELSSTTAAHACLVTADKLASNGHYREALLELDRAIEFQPQLSRELAGKLAIMSSQLGDVPRAKSEFERALSQSPNDSNIMNDYGCFLASQGQLADAEMWYRKALIANHANKRAWNNLGLVLAKQGRAEESLSAFQHAVSQPEAFQNLGMALAKAGHTSQALAYLEKAHSLQPDSKPTELALRIVQRMHSEKNAHVSLAGHIEPAAEQLR